jgi:hypothetical protein
LPKNEIRNMKNEVYFWVGFSALDDLKLN